MTATADAYTESLIALERRAEELRTEIEAAKESEQSAIRAHIKTTPKVRPFSDITSEPAKLRRKITKLSKELASVETELPLMHQAAVDAQREQVERDLLRYELEVRAVEDEIPLAWDKMTEAFAELIRLWVSESGRITRERQRINEAARAACDSHGASREKWEQIYQSQQVHPLPSTFVSALRKMEMDATTDRELAEVLRNRPEAWVSTGMGAALGESVA